MSSFYAPSHSPGWLLIHCLCLPSLSYALLSPMLTVFLPYWYSSAHWGPGSVPALIAGAGSFPSHRGAIKSHHRKLFFYLFHLAPQVYWVTPWECHKSITASLRSSRSLSALSNDRKWRFYIFSVNRSLFPLWILMLFKRLMILLILVDIHRDGQNHILFRIGNFTTRQ